MVNFFKSVFVGVFEDFDGTSEDDGGEDDEDIKVFVLL